ncbi:hypothetical protein [Streptomyces sp. NPDC059278]|uniref:hypothetical protein n=1 Tax=Streptomyces sp. NPDC059278 TaxID=3346801 RepID=UPI003699CCB6
MSDAEYAALDKISQGGATCFTRRDGTTRALDSNGKIIRAKSFSMLDRSRLIRVDTSTPAMFGRHIKITARGSLALDFREPGRAQSASPGSAPTPVKGGNRRR